MAEFEPRRMFLSGPLLRQVARCVCLALVPWGATCARADSAIGVDTATGNAMSPPGRPALPRELSLEDADTVRRSPTGLMYGLPYIPASERSKTQDGWEYHGSIEFGALVENGGKSALVRKYRDPKSGLTVDHFQWEADHADSAGYLQAIGGAFGQDDQFYGFLIGRYNDWKLKVFYNDTRHVFTDTYKSLFNGTGTGSLTLAGGLKPMGGASAVTVGVPTVGAGACTAAAPCWRHTGADGLTRVFSNATAAVGINWTGGATIAAGTPVSPNSIAGSINQYLGHIEADTELGLTRRKVGLSAEKRLDDHWKTYASYTRERRQGARPFGMNENNYSVEIPEPIDYDTHDLLAGVSYTDSLTQFNLRGSASLFRNHVGTLTVEQPWLAAATGFGAAQTSSFDLYPNNDAYNLKLEFARNLPSFYKGRFSANVALGSSRQDDALMLPLSAAQSGQISSALGGTVLPGINNAGYATGTLNLDNWNGVNGWPLSQTSARQRIDTAMVNLGLSVQPINDLGIKADFRHLGTANRGGYTAYNPLTGQFGRGFRNSSAFDLVVGSAGIAGATGGPCYVLAGFPAVPGCVFDGIAPAAGTSTNNPANVPVFSPPRESRQDNYMVSADYELGRRTSINAALEREDIHRTFRERDRTWENRFKAGYVNRDLDSATLRLSFESGRRRGSAYQFWPIGDFGTGLPGLGWDTIVSRYFAGTAGWLAAPANLAGYLARYAYESRKFDLADRDQQVWNARVNVAPRDDLDLGLALQHKSLRYPNSTYGAESDRTTSINADLNYQASSGLTAFGYYSLQVGSKSQRGNSGTGATALANTCSFPATPVLDTDTVVARCAQQVWLAQAAWDTFSRDHARVLGLGVQAPWADMRWGLEYTYSRSATGIRYNFGPNVLTAAQAALAGSAFTDMALVQNTLAAHLLVPIRKNIVAHLLYRHESGRIADWHYSGNPIGASAAENQATVLLDAGPQNYHNNVVGIIIQFDL
jgi:hypothetical protein